MSGTDRSFEVVIPAYNAEKTVTESIQSALAAGATRVIVVDDGSKDATANVARAAGAYVIRQENSGASVARRTGLREVEAPYVIMLDSDDALIPEGVERSLEMLVNDPGVVAAGGSARGFFTDGTEQIIRPNESAPTLKSLLEQGFAPIPPACVVWNSGKLVEALFVSAPEPLLPRYAEDYEMMLRIAMLGRITLHDDPSARYALEGGKSMDDPSRSVRSVSQMRDYYSDYSGIEIRRWRERQISARAHLRLYKNARGTGQKLTHLAAATAADFPLIYGLLRSKVVRSREWKN
ncbi:MAG: glycosyltransferase family A protein [Pseudoclavibacter sp.]